jgi:hypothetical protein
MDDPIEEFFGDMLHSAHEAVAEGHDKFVDWLTGGQLSHARKESAELFCLEGRLKALVKNYKYWYQKAQILSKALYRITLQAYLEVSKIHDIISHLSINQRKIAEHTLQNKHHTLKNIEASIDSLRSISGSSGAVLDTGSFIDRIFDGSVEILESMPGKGGLAAAGIYTVISELQHISSLGNEIYALKAGQHEALKNIDKMQYRLLDLKTKMQRFEEMGMGLGKGLTAFQYCFNDFQRKLFPEGEKSRQERENRVAAGGRYFSDSEQPEIESLLISAGFLLKMIEAKP